MPRCHPDRKVITAVIDERSVNHPTIRAGILWLTLAAVFASMGCPLPDQEMGSATTTTTETKDVTEGGTATEPTSGAATEGATQTAGESDGEWPAVVCNGTSCAAGEFCLQPIPGCELVPKEPCDAGDTDTGGTSTTGDEPEEQCWIELQHERVCTPIPAACQGTLDEITVCLEDGAFGPCPVGGTVTDGVLSCTYNSVDHCEEGESPYSTCQPCQ
jgi:hypothetical protein